MTSRPVKPRARRMAAVVASEPEETRRTFSTEGTMVVISSASSISRSCGAPKLVPLRAASMIASVITAGACPSMSGPQEPT